MSTEDVLPYNELPPESLIARKDFVTLVKLFRDLLYELGRMRAIVNQIELEPHLANKLRQVENIQSPTELLSALQTDRSSASGLLAPFSRLFYGPEAQYTQTRQRPLLGQGRSSGRPTPKLSASSAIAPATVNVEFGGQGGIRRQVSIMPQAGDGGLAGRYRSNVNRSGNNKGEKRDLSGIFAGGGGHQSSSTESWLMLPEGAVSGAPSPKEGSYRGLSKNVDAVIDNTAAAGGEDDFRPRLLERTLRPRGLSDSSIHTTFMSHANPGGRLLTPAGLALSFATTHTSVPRDDQTTVRATMITARPSIQDMRKIINSQNKVSQDVTAPPLTSSSSTQDLSKTLSAKRSARPAALVSSRGKVESDASQSVTGGTIGLFANLGAWASRAGGLAATVQEANDRRLPHPSPSD